MPEVQTICVLGAGDMGHGVAEICAMNGFDVRLRDIDQDVLDKAMEKVRWSLDKLAEKDQLTQDEADAAFARITATTELADAVDGVQLVIEAVPEDLALKRKVFAELEEHAPVEAVLATNTSTICIHEIAEGLADPSRLVGMHFFNPVLLMDLIEIIPGPKSSAEAVETVEAVSDQLGKTRVTLSKDTPGFVTSRLIGIWMGAAAMALEHDIASKEAIDAAMKFKGGFPMGPFELADYTGLDIGVHAGQYIASRLGDQYAPSTLLTDKLEAGELGKKTGQGFYTWEGGRNTARISPDMVGDFDPATVMAVTANEAARLMEEGVASADEIDLLMRNGCAFPKGPLEWADAHGLENVQAILEELQGTTGSALASPVEALTSRVDEGQLGRQSGKGFHTYDGTADAGAGSADAASYETVLVDVDPDSFVGTITLNRPHRLNALNDQLMEDVSAALDQLDRDDRVRAIVLTAAGDKAFCVGADLTDIGDVKATDIAELARRGHLMCLRMEKLGTPVIAAVNGYAFGGGLELALPADLRVAARRAMFALPEVTLGLIPAMGGTQRLPKLIGLSAAKEFALLGNRISAERAHELGLVHRVFDNDTFEADTKAFAAELASRAPIALKLTKQLLNAAPTTDLSAGMEAEAAAFGLVATTGDVVEGVTSMFMKKEPEFKGK